MDGRTLEDVLQSTDNVVEKFWNTDITDAGVHWSVYEEEHTNWIEEQRAWRETAILMDQSYHLANYYFEGPGALRLNSDLGLADFTDLRVEDAPRAKQHPVCNPDGYVIGDPVLFHLGADEVVVTGNRGLAQKWLQYHAETGEYDVTVTDIYSPYDDAPPVDFRFEVQGPNARSIVEEAIDGSLPRISFFGMGEIAIDGVDLYVLGHGMASVPGYEIFGPYEHHDDIKARLLDIGEEYGIRELGAKAYKTATVTTGWLPTGLPAIYENEEMSGYREWLDASVVEANWSLGGSYRSDDLADYYLDPVALGYEHIIDLDHDFVGKGPIAERLNEPEREKVTFVWNGADVVDVYASLFSDGDTFKFMELPDVFQQWDLGHYDRITSGGDTIGLSIFSGYDYNQREMLSLGVVDVEHSDPGTDVTLVWGEEGSPKSRVERHVETEIGATVQPAPYVRGREEL